MGADSGIHIELPETAPSPEPLSVAKLIKASIEKQGEPVDLVIMGKQAIDDDAGQTGQMLAGLLGWSQATFASKVEVDEPNKVALVTREIDGGLQEVKCKLPLIVTTDLRLNGDSYLVFRNRVDANFRRRTQVCLVAKHHEGEKETNREIATFRPWCGRDPNLGDN